MTKESPSKAGVCAILMMAVACTEAPAPQKVPVADAASQADAAANVLAMSRSQLLDPETCKSCHPKHYREWSSSMHAYASTDPVFLAMNKRGQRETDGALGEFCVQCHAPMALREGLTKDGLNMAELPRSAQGVTCYFCHNAVDVGPDHVNAPITLANDTIMRGSIRDPVDPKVHGVAYSEHHDNGSMKSSVLCGACHDVETQKGVHIERTLKEYKDTIFSIEKSGKSGGESCQGCHMRWNVSDVTANVPGLSLPKRDLHEHRWAAVDVALTDFPDREAQRHATECELSADGAYIFQISNDAPGEITVSIETTAGHAQPSGTAQDRRLWMEFIAYDAQDNVIFESGVLEDGEQEERPTEDPKHDKQLWMFRDHFYDSDGGEVHMFWEADKVDSRLLPIAVNRLSNHVATHVYQIPARQTPARVKMRLRMRPVGLDVLQSLVDSGDLDPLVIAEMPTFTLHSTHVDWKVVPGEAIQRPTPLPMPITCP